MFDCLSVHVKVISFLAPTGAQEVTLCVRPSVRHKVVRSTKSSSFWLKSSSNQSGISQQSVSTQKALRVFKSESYSRSLKYCVLFHI